MNWYKQITKTATITFYPAGAEKMAKPMDLMQIATDLFWFLHNDVGLWRGKKDFGYETISPDGDSDFNGPVGVLNFYLSDPSLTREDVEKAISLYNQHKVGDIVIDVGKQEKSGMLPVDVVRLKVVKNDTVSFDSPPEVNVSNRNAQLLLKMLHDRGLNVDPESYAGSIDADDLQTAINMIESMPTIKDEYSVEPSQEWGEVTWGDVAGWASGEGRGPKAYDMGVSPDQYERYLDGLRQMIAWLDKHDLPDRTIYYA